MATIYPKMVIFGNDSNQYSIMNEIRNYLREITKRLQAGGQTEMSYRTDFQVLLRQLLPKEIAITEEAQGTNNIGRPDFTFTCAGRPIGYIETKDIGDRDLEGYQLKGGNKEQFDRYKSSLQNIIFTDYLRFLYYRDGELVMEVSIATLTADRKAKPIELNFGQFQEMIKAFAEHQGVTITSATQLAQLMARKAWLMCDVMEQALTEDLRRAEQAEQQGQMYTSDLLQQLASFRSLLIEDMPPRDFSDVYAQTVTYGLFAARFNDPSLENFSRQEAAELIPRTNPFLRRLFGHIAGPDVDPRILWVLDELVEIFKSCDLKKILGDFDRADWSDDPIIHFYEDFLAIYDRQLRKDRGVWYTPQPVVQYIVGAVDRILQSHFGLSKGLADPTKITVEQERADQLRGGKRKVQVPYHQVQVLDPATGTGTFLAEAIRQIHTKFQEQQGLWQGYVQEHLIPRLNGFELMMASYAIAHLKLDMVLQNTGYRTPESHAERFRIFLTNSLEEAHPDTGTLWLNTLLSNEALEANRIKRDTPVMVVMGNPPYSGESANQGAWIGELMEAYKKEPGGKERLNERNSKWLNDDYVKFLRYGEYMIRKNGTGILAYINPHGYLDNPTFRGMRWHLLETFDEIYVLDLHGNARKKETTPDGGKDENVFDIMQGVSINLFIKDGKKKKGALAKVYHSDLYGLRQEKFDWLTSHAFDPSMYQEVLPNDPNYFFVPKDESGREEYEQGFSVADLMRDNNTGIVTARDHFTIKNSAQEVLDTIDKFLSLDDEQAREYFNLRKDVRDWKVSYARKDLLQNYPNNGKLSKISYRPFDIKYTFYTGVNKGLYTNPRWDIMQHFIKGDNVGLCTTRMLSTRIFQHALVSKGIIDNGTISSATSERSYVFPLYLYSDEGYFSEEGGTRIPNLDEEIVAKISEAIGRRFVPEVTGEEGTFAPIDLLDYIYGLLYHPEYRERYFEFLKVDFPRIPYPDSAACFDQYKAIGGQLRRLHLMEEQPERTGVTYPEVGDNSVSQQKWAEGKVWINKEQYFGNVPEEVWNYYIGGYQPAQKWLKDRRNTTLSFDDITHYQRIVHALATTIALQSELSQLPLP